MSALFPSFDDTKIHLIPYEHQPLSTFIKSLGELRSIAGGEILIDNVIKNCKQLLNKYISGRPVDENYFKNVRESCKIKRQDTLETAISIHKSLKYINLGSIIGECLEDLVLNNEFDRYGLLIESDQQWDYINKIIVEKELDDFIERTNKKDVRESFFDIPIITFLPPHWIPELLTLPPTENFFIIYPACFSLFNFTNTYFKSPNNETVEVSSNNLHVIKNETIYIQADDCFFITFPENINSNPIITTDYDSFIDRERPVLDIEIKDKLGRIQHIESNKHYLTVSINGEFKFTSFENEDQLSSVNYIVNEIDYSEMTDEELKRVKNEMMEKWKRPLREHFKPSCLPSELKALGAIKANPQNIRNWANSNKIAPSSDEDYRAVLLFSGIIDEVEIEQYFSFARERRSESISLGHQKSVITRQLVRRNLIDELNKNSKLDSNYNFHGIKVSLIHIGNM